MSHVSFYVFPQAAGEALAGTMNRHSETPINEKKTEIIHYTYIHTYTHTYTRTYIHAYVRMCIRTYVFTDGLCTKGTRAHTHRELIREWLSEPKGSSLEYI